MLEFTLGTWEYNPKTGEVFSESDLVPEIASIHGYDAPFSLDFEHSIANARLITAAPAMYALLERISEDGFTLEDCARAKDMLAYIRCEDIPRDENGSIDEDKYPPEWLPPSVWEH